NRQAEKAVVYVRHTVPDGYKLTKAPAAQERYGISYLFRVELAANGKSDVELEETTPIFRTTDIRSPDGMELVRAYLSSATLHGELKKKVGNLLAMQKEMADFEQQIATLRDQMQEYRARMDELHGQILSLREVRTGAALLKALEGKMKEISDK